MAAGLLLPRSGKLVLLDELSGIAVIWIVCIYVILKVIHGWKAGGKSIKTAGDYKRTGGNKSAELVYYEHTGRTVSVR